MRRKTLRVVEISGYGILEGVFSTGSFCPWRPRIPREGAKRSHRRRWRGIYIKFRRSLGSRPTPLLRDMEPRGRVPPVGVPESTRHGPPILLLPEESVGGAASALCRHSVLRCAGVGDRRSVETPTVYALCHYSVRNTRSSFLDTRRSQPPGTAIAPFADERCQLGS